MIATPKKTHLVGPEYWPPAGSHIGRARWLCRQLDWANPANGDGDSLANNAGRHRPARYDLDGFGYHRLGDLAHHRRCRQ